MSTHANMVRMTVTSVAGGGTGTITLNAASSGYRSFATAYGADATVDVLITEDATWEVARDCLYTNVGTTLGRGTLESSSTGAAVAFTANAVVSVVATADYGNRLERAMQSVIPGGRLTLESGVPVSTTDQTAKTSVFYTPFVHNVIPLWNGTDWVPTTFTQVTQALGTITSGLPYDVFGFLNGSALNTEILAWTNDTTRATAVTLQDGRYCKSGDKTRLLLGTFYTMSTTTTEDSKANRLLWNHSNRVQRLAIRNETINDWSYNSVTLRQANGSTSNRIRVMLGSPGAVVKSVAQGAIINPAGQAGYFNIGIASITPLAQVVARGGATDTAYTKAEFTDDSVGMKEYWWLEACVNATAAPTFFGTSGTSLACGISADVIG